jgi:3-oxoacyl-[acyl-carrier-protein] synthase II
MNDRRVVITGIGAVTPYGVGAELFWNNIVEGKSAARPITSFDVSQLPTKFAAQVPLSEPELDAYVENQKSLRTLARCGKMAVIAADEAVRSARLDSTITDPFRVGTSVGAGGVGLWDYDYSKQMLEIGADSVGRKVDGALQYSEFWKAALDRVHPLTPLRGLSNIPTAHIAINHNARGPCLTVTTACTSSTQAIGEAYRQIKYGHADAMIAGGSDSMLNPNGITAFSMLGVLSRNNDEYKTAARPFDRGRNGFMLGEGSAMFLVEELDHCRRREATPYAEIMGYASTCDAFRLTDEPSEAWGSIEAMKLVLAEAKMSPQRVDYINAHGTGTQMNDKTETWAIKSVFGRYAYGIPVSSTKSMVGHLVAAAGAVELAACVLALKYQTIPPTINYMEADPECDLDYVPNEARKAHLDIVLSNSFGFGGQNACLLIRKI